MTLFERLNDPNTKIDFDEIMSRPGFWQKDEEVYQETIKKIEEDHKRINMTEEKSNKPFDI